MTPIDAANVRRCSAAVRPVTSSAAPLLALALTVSCATPSAEVPGPPEPAASAAVPASSTAPPAELAPPAAAASGDAAPPAATGPGQRLRVTATMRMEGTISADALKAELDAQTAQLDRCAPLVRKTDPVVGSLNVQLSVAADGSTQATLQSPVNKEAEACLLEGMRAWRVAKAGQGRAMVLLSLADGGR